MEPNVVTLTNETVCMALWTAACLALLQNVAHLNKRVKTSRQNKETNKQYSRFLVSNIRRVFNVIFFPLSDSLVSEFYVPTFRNTLSIPSPYVV